jgi:hypothetical protein
LVLQHIKEVTTAERFKLVMGWQHFCSGPTIGTSLRRLRSGRRRLSRRGSPSKGGLSFQQFGVFGSASQLANVEIPCLALPTGVFRR